MVQTRVSSEVFEVKLPDPTSLATGGGPPPEAVESRIDQQIHIPLVSIDASIAFITQIINDIDALDKEMGNDLLNKKTRIFLLPANAAEERRKMDELVKKIRQLCHQRNFEEINSAARKELEQLFKKEEEALNRQIGVLKPYEANPEIKAWLGYASGIMNEKILKRNAAQESLMRGLSLLDSRIREKEIIAEVQKVIRKSKKKRSAAKGIERSKQEVVLFESNLSRIKGDLELVKRKLERVSAFSLQLREDLGRLSGYFEALKKRYIDSGGLQAGFRGGI